MRAAGHDPVSVSKISTELDQLNASLPEQTLERTPKTPSSKNMELVLQVRQDTRKQKLKQRNVSPIQIGKFSNEGPSNLQIEEIPMSGGVNNACMEKADWSALIPKHTNVIGNQVTVEDNFGFNIQETKQLMEGNNGFMEYNMNFPDFRFSPHLSFSPGNYNPDLFNST